MPYCENCGEHVSEKWVRVYGEGGKVKGCPNCKQNNEMYEGGGV